LNKYESGCLPRLHSLSPASWQQTPIVRPTTLASCHTFRSLTALHSNLASRSDIWHPVMISSRPKIPTVLSRALSTIRRTTNMHQPTVITASVRPTSIFPSSKRALPPSMIRSAPSTLMSYSFVAGHPLPPVLRHSVFTQCVTSTRFRLIGLLKPSLSRQSVYSTPQRHR
jgi:hypothetical protein